MKKVILAAGIAFTFLSFTGIKGGEKTTEIKRSEDNGCDG